MDQNSNWNPVNQGQPAGYGTSAPGGTGSGYASSGGQYPPPPPGGGYPPPGGGYPPPPPSGGYPPPPGYPPQGQPPYGGPQYGGPPAPPAGAGMPPNTAATVAYLTFIPAVIFLVMDPYKRMNFVRFHAWQCIVLTGVSVGVGIAISILSFILAMVHLGILTLLLGLVHWLLMLAFFVFWLIAIIKANKGERYHIPVIGSFAEKFTGTM